MCGKRAKIKNEFGLNKYGLNTKMNGQYKNYVGVAWSLKQNKVELYMI